MRTGWFMLVAASVGILEAGLDAGDKKDVTLKGTLVCAKCTLKEAKECQTAIQVTDNGKKVTYYFKDKGTAEDYHEAVCGAGKTKDGTVTGAVLAKDGKKWITPSDVKFSGTK